MDKHIPCHRGNISVGCVLHSLFPHLATDGRDFRECVATIAADSFFDFVEICGVRNSAIRRDVRRFLKAGSLTVGYGAHPEIFKAQLNLSASDATEAARAVESLRPSLEQAAEFGAEWFVVTSGPDPGVGRRELALDRLVASLVDLCAHARGYGLRVLLEPFDREVDKCFLIGPSCEAAGVATRVRGSADNFGVVLDHAHIPLVHNSLSDAVNPVLPFLELVHLGNCVSGNPRHPLFGDTHPPYGLEGGDNGVEELAALLRVLNERGFFAAAIPRRFSFEIRPPAEWPAEAVLGGAKRTLNAAWRRHLVFQKPHLAVAR